MEDLAREEGAADRLAEEGGEAGAHAAHRHEEGFGLGEVDKDGDERREAAADGDERRLRTERAGADDGRDRNCGHRGRLRVAEEAVLVRREHDTRKVCHRLSEKRNKDADHRAERAADEHNIEVRRSGRDLLDEDFVAALPHQLDRKVHDHFIEHGDHAA